jgi:hypothetical protein
VFFALVKNSSKSESQFTTPCASCATLRRKVFAYFQNNMANAFFFLFQPLVGSICRMNTAMLLLD